MWARECCTWSEIVSLAAFLFLHPHPKTDLVATRNGTTGAKEEHSERCGNRANTLRDCRNVNRNTHTASSSPRVGPREKITPLLSPTSLQFHAPLACRACIKLWEVASFFESIEHCQPDNPLSLAFFSFVWCPQEEWHRMRGSICCSRLLPSSKNEIERYV